MRKLLMLLAVVAAAYVLVSCKGTDEPLTYTVTFDTAGGSAVASQDVLNGGKVTKPEDPTKDGYVFGGDWMNGSFAWDFSIDIVTEDVTLVATWIEVSTTPTNIQMTDETQSYSIMI